MGRHWERALKMNPHLWECHWGAFSHFWSPPLQSLFLGMSPALEVRLLSQLILLSQRLLPTLPTFPQAPGNGSQKVLFHRERTVNSWLPLAHFPLIFHSFLSRGLQSALQAHTSAVPREDGPALLWTVTWYRDHKDPLPNPSARMLGTGPTPFYVFKHAHLGGNLVIISLGSWPQYTLFIVDWK